MSPVFRHGRLRLYLLRLLDEEPRHGYEVIRLLRDRFMGIYAPSPGTIYPRLARLEEEGLVTHDEENGRKVYRITEAGREELRKRSDELDELERELSASVSDIVREVREDVRETVRNLREELTWAAREMRRNEKEAREEAQDTAREQARQARDTARETAREQARQVREQARQARDDAREHAHRIKEEAASLRDDTLGRLRSKYEQAAGQHWSQATGSGDPGEHGGHDWSNWLGWGDWTRWTDRPGRKNWAGPRDMGAFRDLERLAREFAGDLRKVAWESEALGGDVIVTLRNILEETLDRIKTEIFGQHDTAEAAESPKAPNPEDTNAASAPGDSSSTRTPEEPPDSAGTSGH
jgi:DNA-binding PadR family transcriptional regulator